jgi:hypothetical protein
MVISDPPAGELKPAKRISRSPSLSKSPHLALPLVRLGKGRLFTGEKLFEPLFLYKTVK